MLAAAPAAAKSAAQPGTAVQAVASAEAAGGEAPDGAAKIRGAKIRGAKIRADGTSQPHRKADPRRNTAKSEPKPAKSRARTESTPEAEAAAGNTAGAGETGPDAAPVRSDAAARTQVTGTQATGTQVTSLRPLTLDEEMISRQGGESGAAGEQAATEPATKASRKRAKARAAHKAAARRKALAEEQAAAEATAGEAAQVQPASLQPQPESRGFDIVRFLSGLGQDSRSAPPTAPAQPEVVEDAPSDAGRGRGRRRDHGDAVARSAVAPLIAKHAAALGVPASLADAVVRVESRYNPRARNGPYLGLTQMHLNTARAMGYGGEPGGLFDADTNLRYGIKYLAIAYRLAGGDTCRTILKYQAGHRAVSMTQAASKYCARVRTMMAAH